MTAYTCATPKQGTGHLVQHANQFGSRYVGVEVVCGAIVETFLYYTNDTVRGGSNIMIEVQRQGLCNAISVCISMG
jgi:hypothetical protein